ncbi:unnamed protein product [Euphydryas editha]|uniref:Uncharacterized protein n=1 Tax=Euphydryas editha TaxID=104508 RepID=A0AAU9TNC2_EUPED|nr:unnamed protein product [Euphydryas editha]
MYRQILISPEHREYQRILWRSSPRDDVREYRLNTVTYGVASSPYLACRTLRQLADDEGDAFPLAKQIVFSDVYVDDVVCGFDDFSVAQEAKTKLIKLFNLGHFQLRKWVQPTHQTCTKRSILSELARIFDPFGFLSPITIQAKCLIQKLWILGVNWDETPPIEVVHSWASYTDQLPKLAQLRIPRKLTCSKSTSYELHGFCDSSEVAYGAMIYLRATDETGNIQVFFVCSKARVVPLKRIPLPRLELCAAVLLADLYKYVHDTCFAHIPFNSVFLWSDATIVLSWLHSHASRWTTFLANRVSHC